MSKHKNFYVWPKPNKSKKKKTLYYQYRQTNGKMSNAKSTYCTSRTAAYEYVENLIKTGKIKCGEDLTFFAFAIKFFDFNSTWVRDKKALGTENHPAITDRQVQKYQSFVKNYILKYLQNKLVSEFTPSDIKEFRVQLLEKENLARKTINDIMSCLRIIFTSALNDGLITLNPFRGISPLVTEPKYREAIPIDIVKILLHNNWTEPRVALCILTAALTGMRISEIQAIRKENLKETYIDLQDQYIYHGLNPLKTREARKIPICPELYTLLVTAIPSGETFVFAGMRENLASDKLREFLIKSMPEQRKAHGWCFHMLRRTANTYYLAENISDVKVAAIMGHSTGVTSMQERYTNFTPENYAEIYEAQTKLFHILMD